MQIDTEEVAGSNPVVPTIYLHIIKELADRFNLASGESNPLSNP